MDALLLSYGPNLLFLIPSLLSKSFQQLAHASEGNFKLDASRRKVSPFDLSEVVISKTGATSEEKLQFYFG